MSIVVEATERPRAALHPQLRCCREPGGPVVAVASRSQPEETVLRDALPVQVEVAEPLGARVRAWLEGTLGWQVVDDASSAAIPPVCRITDVQGDAGPPGTPSVLLIIDTDDPASSAQAATRTRPGAVIRWPDQRDELPRRVAALGAAAPALAPPVRQLRIASASGGVGATTVALAVGGLCAWAGRAVLVVARGPVPVPGVRELAADDLAGSGTWNAASTATGCPGLRVVGCGQPFGHADVDPGPAEVLVRDLGPGAEPDVLVLRRDHAGVQVLGDTSAGMAAVVDDGIVPLRRIAEVAGNRRLLVLPRSARVARAGVLQRVPASLPGRWVQALTVIASELHPQSPSIRFTAEWLR